MNTTIFERSRRAVRLLGKKMDSGLLAVVIMERFEHGEYTVHTNETPPKDYYNSSGESCILVSEEGGLGVIASYSFGKIEDLYPSFKLTPVQEGSVVKIVCVPPTYEQSLDGLGLHLWILRSESFVNAVLIRAAYDLVYGRIETEDYKRIISNALAQDNEAKQLSLGI
jgi:hypothetical protein